MYLLLLLNIQCPHKLPLTLCFPEDKEDDSALSGPLSPGLQSLGPQILLGFPVSEFGMTGTTELPCHDELFPGARSHATVCFLL